MNKSKLTHRFIRGVHLFCIATLLAGMALSVAPPKAAYAADNINVTADSADVLDANSGDCATMTIDDLANDNPNGETSLREAICAANNTAGADVITLPAGTYTLTIEGTDEDANATGDLDITDDLTINGAGEATTIIDGGGKDRVLHIMSDVTVVINDVTITNGKTDDGGPGGAGAGDGGDGGGIYNVGTADLTNSTVSGNTTGNGGGALGVGGHGGDGGGIYNVGTADLTNSTVSGNTTGNGGNGGDGSGGDGGHGGGIYNVGTADLTNSTVSGNTTGKGGNGLPGGDGGDGGGIYNVGTADLTNSTVSGNTTGNGGGAAFGGDGGDGGGGGFGGGIYNVGTADLTNSTVSGNTTGNGGEGGAFGDSGDGGDGGGIYNDADTDFKNTIIANNTAGSGAPDCGGNLDSYGYNLVEDPSDCTINEVANPGTDITGQDPNLGPLQDNGGPTFTHALQVGSPAIDAIPPISCTVTDDQRGVSRPQPTGGNCDIGAYELEQQPPVPVGGVVVPVNKLGLVAPWLGLVALAGFVALGVVVVRRRRGA